MSQVRDFMIRLQQGKGFEQTMQLLVLMHSIATMEDAAKSEGQAPAASGTSQASAKIYKVRNYVMENFRGRIERDAVAKLAGLSANGFSRFFKQHTGMNFTDYVNLVRLEEASRLLQTTDDTVSGNCLQLRIHHTGLLQYRVPASSWGDAGEG